MCGGTPGIRLSSTVSQGVCNVVACMIGLLLFSVVGKHFDVVDGQVLRTSSECILAVRKSTGLVELHGEQAHYFFIASYKSRHD